MDGQRAAREHTGVFVGERHVAGAGNLHRSGNRRAVILRRNGDILRSGDGQLAGHGSAGAFVDDLHIAGAVDIRRSGDRRIAGVCGDRDILRSGDGQRAGDRYVAAAVGNRYIAGTVDICRSGDRRIVGVCGDRDILRAGDGQRSGHSHAGTAVDDGYIAGTGDHRRTHDHLAAAGCRYRDILRTVDGQRAGDRQAGAAVGERNIAGAGDVHRAGERRIAAVCGERDILHGEGSQTRGDGGIGVVAQHHVCGIVAGDLQKDAIALGVFQSTGDGEGVGRRVIADLAVVDAVRENIGIVDLVDIHAVDADAVAGGAAELHKAVGRAVFIGGGGGREAIFRSGAPQIPAKAGQVGLRIQGGMALRALVHVVDTDMAAGDVQLSRLLRGFGTKARYGIDAVAQLVSAEADDIQIAARDLHSGNLGCLVGIGEFRIDAVACVIAVLADGKERGMAGDADGSASFPTVGIDACAEVRAFAAGGLHGGVAGDGETLFVANGLDAKGVCRRAGRGNDLTAGDGEGAVI